MLGSDIVIQNEKDDKPVCSFKDFFFISLFKARNSCDTEYIYQQTVHKFPAYC